MRRPVRPAGVVAAPSRGGTPPPTARTDSRCPSPCPSRWSSRSSSWSIEAVQVGWATLGPLLFRRPDRAAALEHRQPHGRGHLPLRGRRDPRRLVRRAHRRSRPPHLGGARGHSARHSGLRRQFRLAGHLSLVRRLLGGHPRHDARRLPARLPPGGGEPAQRRSGPGGGGPQPGPGPVADVLAGDSGPGPAGHPRWRGAGRPGGAGRVRGLRDPRLPDPHHRDLHRVHRRASTTRRPVRSP